jgi:hypothetical protein
MNTQGQMAAYKAMQSHEKITEFIVKIFDEAKKNCFSEVEAKRLVGDFLDRLVDQDTKAIIIKNAAEVSFGRNVKS